MQVCIELDEALTKKIPHEDIAFYIQELVKEDIQAQEEYEKTKEFLENKAYFQKVLAEIESGATKLLDYEEAWERISSFTKK